MKAKEVIASIFQINNESSFDEICSVLEKRIQYSEINDLYNFLEELIVSLRKIRDKDNIKFNEGLHIDIYIPYRYYVENEYIETIEKQITTNFFKKPYFTFTSTRYFDDEKSLDNFTIYPLIYGGKIIISNHYIEKKDNTLKIEKTRKQIEKINNLLSNTKYIENAPKERISEMKIELKLLIDTVDSLRENK